MLRRCSHKLPILGTICTSNRTICLMSGLHLFPPFWYPIWTASVPCLPSRLSICVWQGFGVIRLWRYWPTQLENITIQTAFFMWSFCRNNMIDFFFLFVRGEQRNRMGKHWPSTIEAINSWTRYIWVVSNDFSSKIAVFVISIKYEVIPSKSRHSKSV